MHNQCFLPVKKHVNSATIRWFYLLSPRDSGIDHQLTTQHKRTTLHFIQSEST